jgi:hypothetical protein
VLGQLALGDVLAEQDDPAHRAVGLPPGPQLPAQPLHGAIEPLEGVFVRRQGFSGQAPSMHLPPVRRDLGEDVIVAAADDVLVAQEVIVSPAAADLQITHLAIEHGQGGRAWSTSEAQAFAVIVQRHFGSLALGDVAGDAEGAEDLALGVLQRPLGGEEDPWAFEGKQRLSLVSGCRVSRTR